MGYIALGCFDYRQILFFYGTESTERLWKARGKGMVLWSAHRFSQKGNKWTRQMGMSWYASLDFSVALAPLSRHWASEKRAGTWQSGESRFARWMPTFLVGIADTLGRHRHAANA